MLKNTEEEEEFYKSLKFLRKITNQPDNDLITTLISEYKKDIHINVLFSLIERNEILPKYIVVELLWFFIGFFNADKRVINEILTVKTLKSFASLLTIQDTDILENVS